MLWNPENDKPKTQPDETTEIITSLIDWLEMQPKAMAYNIHDHATCLFGKYAEAMGYVNPALKSGDLFCNMRLHQIAIFAPHTYGGALKRARGAAAGPKEN